MRHNFCAFILSHGRANGVVTLGLLKRKGYTGDWYIVCDDGDSQLPEYKRKFGKRVLVFNKAETGTDVCDNFKDAATPVEARNACFFLAKHLGYDYFVELDDDYTGLYYRRIVGDILRSVPARNFDHIFDSMCDFLDCDTRILSVSLCQGGDFIGGAKSNAVMAERFYRKAMNSFVCRTDRPFAFRGHFNDDVSMYVVLSQRGYIFTQTPRCQINQHETQQCRGGITEAYLKFGTFTKSFMTVMQAPSCTIVKTMGTAHERMHHFINPDLCYPKVISAKWRKTKAPPIMPPPVLPAGQ